MAFKQAISLMKLVVAICLTLNVCLITWIFTRIHFVERNNIKLWNFLVRFDYASVQFYNCWISEETIPIAIIMHDWEWIVFGQKTCSCVLKSLVHLQELAFNILVNIIPIDFDMLISVGPLMLMIKSKSVKYLK